MTDRCFYFGCWNRPGHYMHRPDGRWDHSNGLEYYGGGRHLDSSLAPRRTKAMYGRSGGGIVYSGSTSIKAAGQRITYDSEECPQGQFLRHDLDSGFTAISWWDRQQGDGRGACNSTILLEGAHTSEEMLAALAEHFPHVLANLEKAGVKLVEVQPEIE